MNDKAISILSYNIWFDEYERTERLFSLIENIKCYDPDVVCLQEVLNFQYDTIKENLDYPFSYPKKITDGYGCIILSKHPIKKSISIKLKSNMCRKLLISLINYNNVPIVIANTHFESEFGEKNMTKLLQFKYVSVVLKKLFIDYNNVILCADTNVTRSEETIFAGMFNNMNDSWKETGKDKRNEFTYDYMTNTNLQMRNIKLQRRIDKILYKTTKIRLKSFRLIRGILGMIQPSDHHGVLSVFVFED